MVDFTAFLHFLSRLSYPSSKITKGIQILFGLKHSRALALKDEKIANIFKNKVSRVQWNKQTDSQTDLH